MDDEVKALVEKIWDIVGHSPDDGMDFLDKDRKLEELIITHDSITRAKALREAAVRLCEWCAREWDFDDLDGHSQGCACHWCRHPEDLSMMNRPPPHMHVNEDRSVFHICNALDILALIPESAPKLYTEAEVAEARLEEAKEWSHNWFGDGGMWDDQHRRNCRDCRRVDELRAAVKGRE